MSPKSLRFSCLLAASLAVGALPLASTSHALVVLCGDGLLIAPEECDDGDENSNSDVDACRLDCTSAGCGDGVIDTGETCDDGNEEPGDTCSATCQNEEAFCGDGVVQFEFGEICDNGEANSDADADACRTDCTESRCGDTVVDTGEGCDDGNFERYDGCSSSCEAEVCPSGELAELGENILSANTCEAVDIDPAVAIDGEPCGDGTVGGEIAMTFIAPEAGTYTFSTVNGGTDYDTVVYLRDSCGAAESIDCNDDTTGEAPFGGGQSDLSVALEADQSLVVYVGGRGNACGNFVLSVTAAACGDGNVDENEECDDGNTDGGDGCTEICTSEFCGDGLLDETAGEQCDDGDANSNTTPDACRETCALARCGDAVVDTGEECDAGTENSDGAGGSCRTDCTLPFCGDGVVDAGEGCDEGGANSADPDATCRPDCEPAGCGDGIVSSAEQCDEGALNSDTAPDACRENCAPPSCGDGVVDDGEACDSGDGNGTDGVCSSTCEAEASIADDAMPDAGTDDTVGDAGDDAGSGTDDDNSGSDGGCAAAAGTGFGLWWLVGLLGLRRRRA
ncbi:MAG: cysteine-rich repeat protein [Bradymonadia bacterium]|jgi:cysteine-rich repeat protein